MAVTHPILTKDGVKSTRLTPMSAIRAKCMECSNFNFAEITRCHITDCALWIYRFGKKPDQKGRKPARGFKKEGVG